MEGLIMTELPDHSRKNRDRPVSLADVACDIKLK
jgi:hypothetical protein